MLCPECGAEMRPTSDRIVEHYRGVEICIEGIEHMACDSCNEIMIPKKSMSRYVEAANSEYRRKEGLLSPSEIRETRKRLGLTQKQFQQMVGVKDPTVSRWETGKVVQDKVADNLIRAIRDHECVARQLMGRNEIFCQTPSGGECYRMAQTFTTSRKSSMTIAGIEEVLSE